jgi:hypothetical protein
MIVAIELKTMYALASEHDFTGDPRRIEVGSHDSLLRALVGEA